MKILLKKLWGNNRQHSLKAREAVREEPQRRAPANESRAVLLWSPFLFFHFTPFPSLHICQLCMCIPSPPVWDDGSESADVTAILTGAPVKFRAAWQVSSGGGKDVLAGEMERGEEQGESCVQAAVSCHSGPCAFSSLVLPTPREKKKVATFVLLGIGLVRSDLAFPMSSILGSSAALEMLWDERICVSVYTHNFYTDFGAEKNERK